LIVFLFVDVCFFSTVHNLNDQNILATLRDGNWLVKFVSPSCGYCKGIDGVFWEELGEELKTDGVKVGSINAVENTVSREIFELQGYPTIIYVTNKKVYRHSGASRTQADLVAWVREGHIDSLSEELPLEPGPFDNVMSHFKTAHLELKSLIMDKPEFVALYSSLGFLIGMIYALLFITPKRYVDAKVGNKPTVKTTKVD